MSYSVWPYRRQPTRLPHPWDSPGKNTGVVAISFSNAWKWKVKVKSLSHVRLFATPWTAAYSLPGSSIQGIFQARVLEWGAIAFSVLKLALFRWKFRSINYTKKNEVKSVYCSPPGSSVHRILEARILEWVTISFSRRIQRSNPGLPHWR